MRARPSSRREFLSDVGKGMIVAGLGYSTALDLGLAPALADEPRSSSDRLAFGARERLASLVQETPPDKLLPALLREMRAGTELKDLVAAAALANARTFGGEDYVGFHTFMALAPAYRMALELPAGQRALPVLKVLYRNASRIHERGAAAGEALKPVAPTPREREKRGADAIRDAVHRRDVPGAEGLFAGAACSSASEAWDDLLETVHEAPEVHRIVLAHRAWDMLELAGKEHAHTMLRQSLRYCLRNEEHSARHFASVRQLLPKLLDEHKLVGRAVGTRAMDDAWIERMVQTLFTSTPEQAAGAVAASLAEGIAGDTVAEAVTLAANQLILRDSGRTSREAQANKPVGSVHGDSIGLHACDSANAWRNIARTASQRNAIASLILAGYQVALDRVQRGGNFQEWKPRPHPEHIEKVTAKDPAELLSALDGAIRAKDQELACAAAQRSIDLGHPARPVFDLLLKYSTSEDGALHAEKYYRTATDEFANTRAAFRGRHVVALARVAASQYGTPAPGYVEACKLLEA